MWNLKTKQKTNKKSTQTHQIQGGVAAAREEVGGGPNGPRSLRETKLPSHKGSAAWSLPVNTSRTYGMLASAALWPGGPSPGVATLSTCKSASSMAGFPLEAQGLRNEGVQILQTESVHLHGRASVSPGRTQPQGQRVHTHARTHSAAKGTQGCMCARTNAHKHTHVQTRSERKSTHTNVCTCALTHACAQGSKVHARAALTHTHARSRVAMCTQSTMCTRAHTHMSTHTHTHACTLRSGNVHTGFQCAPQVHTHTYVHAHTHTHMHAPGRQAHTQDSMCACTAHAHTHTCTRTNTHVHPDHMYTSGQQSTEGSACTCTHTHKKYTYMRAHSGQQVHTQTARACTCTHTCALVMAAKQRHNWPFFCYTYIHT